MDKVELNRVIEKKGMDWHSDRNNPDILNSVCTTFTAYIQHSAIIPERLAHPPASRSSTPFCG